MSLRQRAVQGVVWSAIQNWGSNLLSMAVFLVLARLLMPEAFGLVALASAFTGFLAVFLTQGFGGAIVQRSELEPEHLDTAFWINVLSGVALTAICIACAGVVARLFGEPQLKPLVRWLSLSLLIGAFSATQEAILMRRLAFKSLAIRRLVASAAGGCVGIGMAVGGLGVWSLVGQNLAGGLVGVAALWQASEWRPGFNVSAKHARDLFSFGINMLGIQILRFVNRRADTMLIGYFLGPVALGYYTVAYGLLLRMTQMLMQTVSSVSLPTFSRLQHDPGQMRHAFFTAIRMTSLLAFPAFIGVATLAPELVPGLFGSKWTPSIPVMQILALIGILQSVQYFNGSVILAMGKPSWLLALRALSTVVHVTAFAVAVRWGIVAVAGAFVMSGYILSPLPAWMVHKLIGVKLTRCFWECAAPLAASLTMMVCILISRALLDESMNLYAVLSFYIISGALVYVSAILVIAPNLPREVMDLARLAVSGQTTDNA
ncbi:MAG: lipopolysaccharide biosynthesis protein [Phycisphaerales bacterium]|nr:MAG: lipopolysaccharide biosynthesis protein [Phycisphaerales bacterium]